jgi:membrane peptidoglycan carboxypeptidase
MARALSDPIIFGRPAIAPRTEAWKKSMAQTPPERISPGRPEGVDPGRAAARPRRGLVGIAVGLFGALVALGIVGAIAIVLLYVGLSSGLQNPTDLEKIQLNQESVVLDRTGKIVLARFGDVKRQVLTFDQIPKIAIDATTAVEDKTFWTNAGFDPLGILSATLDSIRGRARGASTITQQLVRQRLLPQDLVADPNRTFERKAEEIIQSIRVAQTYSGEEGKQKVVTAYLNQNYYGNQDYGIAAAARDYFGLTDLSKMTLAQAAILAAIPKSPTHYDLVRNAVDECTVPVAADADCPAGKSQLVVPADSDVVQRRNQVLDLMAQGRTPLTGTQYGQADFEAAKSEKVVLAPQTEEQWVAPHFVWAVRSELTTKLCGAAPTCPPLERGGLQITTTLDAGLQKLAERWVKAAAVVPKAKDPLAAAKAIGLTYQPWMRNLRGRQINNGALVAIDYQTGELVAYVGSADYYAAKASKKFQPKFDVLADGWRQPGSAFKPLSYVTGIDTHRITAASMFMDVTTDFGGGYTPTDADNLERGPVRVRNALEFSLNIPAIKALAVIGQQDVFDRARQFGLQFQNTKPTAGLSMAIGTEVVHPVDLVTAYGTLANGGDYVGHTTILRVTDQAGVDQVPPYQPPTPKQVVAPQSAAIITDILAGNTTPSINPFWGKFELTAGRKHRPATLKTGTNNDARDLNAYGYIAPPSDTERKNGQYALAVGVWNGNSDNTVVSTPQNPVFSIDVSTFVWQGFLQQATKGWAVDDFKLPGDLTRAKVDPFTGEATNARNGIDEIFAPGTAPTGSIGGGGSGSNQCGPELLQSVGFEAQHDTWLQADRDWLARAERGPGVAGGPKQTRTTYFYQSGFTPYGRAWGDLVGGSCASPSPSVSECPSGLVPIESGSPDASGSVTILCTSPSPSPSESASPSPLPSPLPSPTPEKSTGPPSPTAKPTSTPKPTPTPQPSTASVAPTAAPSP